MKKPLKGRAAANWPLVLPLAVTSGLFVFFFLAHMVVIDDAYISFRYLDNLLSGEGLVFNPGERVEGYTNFFWILLLAPLRALGMDCETASRLLSFSSLAVLFSSVYLAVKALTGNRTFAVCSLILAMGSAPLAFWAGSGMETVLFAALIALANVQIIRDSGHSFRSSACFGLAALTRPDGALLFLASFLAALLVSIRKRPELAGLVRAALFFAVPLLAHLAFRLLYYGSPLPNTFYAKLGVPADVLLPSGIEYVTSYVLTGGAVLLLAALSGIFAPGLRNWIGLSLLGQVAIQFLYVVRVGGDVFPFHRFLVPVLPLLAIAGGAGIGAVAERLLPKQVRFTPVLASLLAGIQLLISFHSLEKANSDILRERHLHREAFASWLGTFLPETSKIAVNAAGLIPYRTGLYTIDMLGLNDYHIARQEPKLSAEGLKYVAHLKHDGPYVFSKSPTLVITGGAHLREGRSPGEAVMNAAVGNLSSDRELMKVPGFESFYRAVAEEVLPGRYAVAYLRREKPLPSQLSPPKTESPEDWYRYGMDLKRRARLHSAITAFQKALQLKHGEEWRVLTELAYCYHDLQQFDSAIPFFKKALALNPGAYNALFGLAQASQFSGRLEDSIPLWERYLAEAPDSTWKDVARNHLAQARAKSRF